MATNQKSRIQRSVESKLERLLAKNAEKAEKEELQVLSIAVKYLAVSAKLDEGNWGGDLPDLEDANDPENELNPDNEEQ